MTVQRCLDLRTLWSGDGFQVLTSTWDRERHPMESDRCVDSASIEWMRRGAYRKRVGGREVVGDVNTAVFFSPGEEFHVSHPDARPNAGTTLRLDAALLDRLLDERGISARARRAGFLCTHMYTSADCHLLQQRLVSTALSGRGLEPLVVEETVYRLLEMVLAALPAPSTGDTASAVQLRRAQLAQEFLNASFVHRLHLADVAQAAGCSPSRICHVFHIATGMTLQRYLMRIRLRYVLSRVHEGEGSLTTLALQAGFSSHSHLTAAFRREFGVTPSWLRRGANERSQPGDAALVNARSSRREP